MATDDKKQTDSKSIKDTFSPLYKRLNETSRRIADIETKESGPAVLVMDTTLSTLTNSVTLTSLYSPTIQAGSIGTNSLLRGSMPFLYRNATGSTATLLIKVVYGGINLLTFDLVSPAVGATSRNGMLEFSLWGNGSVTSQRAFGRVQIGALLLTPAANLLDVPASSVIAANSAASQSLLIQAQHGTASTNIYFTAQYLLVEGPILSI